MNKDIKEFSEVFEFDINAPQYTACVAIVIFKQLIYWEVLKGGFDTIKCYKGFDVPKTYCYDLKRSGFIVSDTSEHCLKPMYNYKKSSYNQEELERRILSAAICIFTEEDKYGFDPHKVGEEIAVQVYNFRQQLKNNKPVGKNKSTAKVPGTTSKYS